MIKVSAIVKKILKHLEQIPVTKEGDNLSTSFDIDKLAYSVSQAETGGCKTGSAKYLNCFGIVRNGRFERYAKKEDSFEDFKQLWTKHYGGYPTREMAIRYTGGDRVDNWLQIVKYYYYN